MTNRKIKTPVVRCPSCEAGLTTSGSVCYRCAGEGWLRNGQSFYDDTGEEVGYETIIEYPGRTRKKKEVQE